LEVLPLPEADTKQNYDTAGIMGQRNGLVPNGKTQFLEEWLLQ
jgi:hypothetical protein